MKFFTVFTILVLGFAELASAKLASADNFKKVQARVKTSEKKDSKKEGDKGLSLSSTLSTRTDLADEKPERSYSHSLGVGVGYSFESISLSAGSSYSYISLNTDVVEPNYAYDGLSDTTVGISFLDYYSVSGTIPTSEASQFEGLKGSLTLSAGYKHDLGDSIVSLSHGLSYDYLFNTFVYSPISNKPTYEMTLGYSLGMSAQIISQFSIGMGFDARTARLNDGSTEMGSNVSSSFSLSTGYKYENFSIGLSYGSGNFFDDKFQNNWFLNQYQQVISVRLGYKWL